MAPFFSLIIPVYNVKDYVERCVQSVLEQNFTDYEIVLVDDGSTDGSGQLCDVLAERGEQITVIHKENGGLSSARNAGMEKAQGAYIWFVDSDDWIEPASLELLHSHAVREEPDMIKFDYIRVEQTSVEIHSNAKAGVYRDGQLEEPRNLAFLSGGRYVLSACCHVYSRTFLHKNRFSFISERVIYSEDYLFNLEILAKAEKVCVLDRCLYCYEQRMGSLTQQYKKNLPQRYAKLYTSLRESYEKFGLLAQYSSRISAFYIWHLLRGTCIPNAYYVAQGHTMQEGRREIREFLSTDDFRQAYKCLDKKLFSVKNRLHLMAMKWKCEPLFYWLYVRKPALKKGKIYENKA